MYPDSAPATARLARYGPANWTIHFGSARSTRGAKAQGAALASRLVLSHLRQNSRRRAKQDGPAEHI